MDPDAPRSWEEYLQYGGDEAHLNALIAATDAELARDVSNDVRKTGLPVSSAARKALKGKGAKKAGKQSKKHRHKDGDEPAAADGLGAHQREQLKILEEQNRLTELYKHSHVTAMGKFLSQLPFGLELGKLLAYSAAMGPDYLPYGVVLASALSMQDIFTMPHPMVPHMLCQSSMVIAVQWQHRTDSYVCG